MNCLLEHVIEGKIKGKIIVTGNEEEGVRSYWTAIRKRENTVN